MASFFEIYIARHAESEGKVRRRETIEEFRATVRMRNQDEVKNSYDLVKALTESQIEAHEDVEAAEVADEPTGHSV